MGDGLEGLLAGRTLVGRYRIEEVIGRGGFAVVYRAEDLRLGRPVAVKVITRAALDEAGRDALRERFQHEARAAASLPHHPNVVTVHDFGTDQETGIDFLAMELLIGETLAQYLAAHPRPVREVALHILRAAAEGVAIGHRAGVVHRDVKPGNIFLAEPLDDSHPFRICVLDFGIAGLVDGEDATLAGGEAVALSPAYATVDTFDVRFDRFWSAMRQRRERLHAVRDAATLTWRFALERQRPTIVAVPRGNAFAGYAVLVRRDQGDLLRFEVADLQALDDDPVVLRAVMNGALGAAVRQGIHLVALTGFSGAKRHALSALKPHVKTVPGWPLYYKAIDGALDERLRSADAWDLSLYDGDTLWSGMFADSAVA
jgi:tRNA A-37 threonylcarbamoyl transferase component Bud32